MTRHPGGWFVATTAHVSGDVRLGRDVSLWFGASVRGDVAPLTIGDGTNVQDNAVLHCDAGVPNDVGRGVTIGHGAIVHGRRVGDGSLVGMGATLLGGTIIGDECLVAAGAVVPPNMNVPDRTLVAGVPARVVREVREADLAYLRKLPPHYVRLAGEHADGRFPIGGRPLDADVEPQAVEAEVTSRVGHGHDVHRVVAGGHLVLGGVVVARDCSFDAHSDGDVVYHAVVDALLGAIGGGDIGRLFDNTDPRWSNADSRLFVEEAMRRVRDAGLAVVNVDVMIHAEQPKLAAHVDAMANNLAALLGGAANVKAGTNEGLDAVGRGDAIAATAVVLLAADTAS